jgi:rod shape-determining protein MreD
MFVVRCIAAVFVLLVSETSWLPKLRIGGIGPDLFLGIVFVLALRKGTSWGVWAGFFLGLLIGAEEPASLGSESLALVLAGLVIGRASHSVDKQNPIVLVLLLILSSLVAETVRVIWLAKGSPGATFLLWWRWVPGSVIYTAILVPVLGWVAARLLGVRGWISSAA